MQCCLVQRIYSECLVFVFDFSSHFTTDEMHDATREYCGKIIIFFSNFFLFLRLFNLFRVLANRLSLDGQGRLVLRESGKIVLPYEHFANAVMLKHMAGPHGMHLSLDATIRSVVESYTIGRENFGMEKEFIVEVVQACPNPACRYYKTHMGNSVAPPPQFSQGPQPNMDYLQHMSQAGMPNNMSNVQAAAAAANQSNPGGIIDMTQMDANNAVVSTMVLGFLVDFFYWKH